MYGRVPTRAKIVVQTLTFPQALLNPMKKEALPRLLCRTPWQLEQDSSRMIDGVPASVINGFVRDLLREMIDRATAKSKAK